MISASHPKITLHHLNNSRSQRILWLLEELALPYEIKFYERNQKTLMAPSELKKIHPLGKSPLLTVGDLVLAESGAIVEYLVDHFSEGQLKPKPGTAEHLRYQFWLHYAEASAMTPLMLKLIFDEIERAPMPFFAKLVVQLISSQVNRTFIRPQLKLHLNYIETELAAHAWFAGQNFTAADIQMSFPLEGAAARSDLMANFLFSAAFLKRIHARPAYQRALEKGGAYQL